MTSIVVDSCVARAIDAKGMSQKSPALECIKALEAIGTYNAGRQKLLLALSKDLEGEWRKHATQYFTKWVANMVARKYTSVHNGSWHGETALLDAAEDLPGKRGSSVKKDVHIVRLAMLSGKRVLSLDARQKELLGEVRHSVKGLDELNWVAPTHPNAASWLRDGAPLASDHALSRL